MRAIRDLGLLDTDPVDVKGTPVIPRDAFIAAASANLHKPNVEDLVILRVIVSGVRQERSRAVSLQLIDYCDAEHGISAMMRVTG